MIDPPLPGIPSILLAVAARLGYQITVRSTAGADLGVFTDGVTHSPMLLAGAGGTSVAWTVPNAAPPPQFAPYLMSQLTYEVLHTGALQRDGSVLYQGRGYHVRAVYDGAHLIAEAFTS